MINFVNLFNIAPFRFYINLLLVSMLIGTQKRLSSYSRVAFDFVLLNLSAGYSVHLYSVSRNVGFDCVAVEDVVCPQILYLSITQTTYTEILIVL